MLCSRASRPRKRRKASKREIIVLSHYALPSSPVDFRHSDWNCLRENGAGPPCGLHVSGLAEVQYPKLPRQRSRTSSAVCSIGAWKFSAGERNALRAERNYAGLARGDGGPDTRTPCGQATYFRSIAISPDALPANHQLTSDQ